MSPSDKYTVDEAFAYMLGVFPGVDQVTCPRCGATGTPCVTPNGKPANMHHERTAAWKLAQPPKPNDKFDASDRKHAARTLERFEAAKAAGPPARLPDGAPHWMKYRRTQVINIVKRRLKHPLPPFDEADAFLSKFETSVVNSLGDHPDYPGSLLEHHDAYLAVEVRGDVNTPESMARGELNVRWTYTLTTGKRFTFTVGYRQKVAA